jgi:hypothetical protein
MNLAPKCRPFWSDLKNERGIARKKSKIIKRPKGCMTERAALIQRDTVSSKKQTFQTL